MTRQHGMFITSTWYEAICSHNQLIITSKVLQEMSVQYGSAALQLTAALSGTSGFWPGESQLELIGTVEKIKEERNPNRWVLVGLTASARLGLFFYRPSQRPRQANSSNESASCQAFTSLPWSNRQIGQAATTLQCQLNQSWCRRQWRHIY